MENKILLVTNRGVRRNRKGATLFKNRMTKSSHRLRCAEVNKGSKRRKYALSLVDQGNEQDHITHAVASGNDRPWVIFVHGNNQTLDKNLEKCFKMRALYDVNVLAFSWPSVHHGKISGLLKYIPRQPNVGVYAARQLKNKIKQYRKAKINAELSAPDLVNALKMAKLALEAASRKANFVSHSLGNYVVANATALKDSLSAFDSVLLHQADAENENHRVWVDAMGKGQRVVVTTNEKDKILEISNIYNHKSLKNKRLGNVKKEQNDGSPIYKDFTGARNIGLTGHTIFLTSAGKNEEVFSFFNPIIGQ